MVNSVPIMLKKTQYNSDDAKQQFTETSEEPFLLIN